jgi:propanol-preferring alcohol dehydrogenase
VLIRVAAAGICHSDAHYRAGRSPVGRLPLILGHEVAGRVEEAGSEVSRFRQGDPVCVHYLATCGECGQCQAGHEQFCAGGQMIGKHRDGGFAEFIAMPARSIFAVPPEVPLDHAAVMMCSSATSLHALRKARLAGGETVAIFGAGGLGLSAIQLARALGAHECFAVDVKSSALELARSFGAVPVNAAAGDPVRQIRELTHGRGVDVCLEFTGLPAVMRQSVQALAIRGRTALVGITEKTFDVAPYHELINREAEIIGVSDHLAQELPLLLRCARAGRLDLSNVITNRIPLEADAVNQILDRLERFAVEGRTVIMPAGETME